MNDNESKWKRSKPSRIYDYNYKVSEGYYKPQTEYIDNRYKAREEQAPDDTHLSYAERYAARPWYGGTRGLPYDENKAELNKPLLKPSKRPRGSSLVREIQEDEKDNIPLNIRAYRRKKKMEDEEEKLGIRPKPKTLAASSSLDSFKAKPNLKEEIRTELRRIDDQMNRALERTRRSPSLPLSSITTSISREPNRNTTNYEEYTTPSGSKVKKFSQSSSYQSTSSTARPPHAPRSRNISLSEDTSSTIGRPRSRINSFSSELPPSAIKPFRQISYNSDDDDDEDLMPVYTNKAARIREQRRKRESEALTENIHKMVDKMRVGNVDPTAVYNYHKSLRASSLEPPKKSKNTTAQRFVYGVGRI